MLGWMVAGTALTTLARDSRVSRATAYRYLHEALGVIADRAPDLPEVLQRLRRSKEPNAGLDGTLIRTDRVAPAQPGHGPPPVVLGQGEGVRGQRAGGDGSHRVPRVYGSGGARLHPRPDRGQTPRAAGPVPVGLVGDAGPGGQGVPGAGIGILVPTKNPCPTPDEEACNSLLSALRAPAKREGAMFKHFRALQRVSPGPATITTIMAAALVIITLWHES